nr:hypothetical protein [Tanacetum cinerariifolium]
DPASGAWNMETGASSQVNDSHASLSDVFNTYLSIYFASSRNTSTDPSYDLTKVMQAYMKVMQAYDVTHNELPIPSQASIAPLTILPPYLMLSPSLNSRDFFRPEEILPPMKRAHGRSSSSTSVLP